MRNNILAILCIVSTTFLSAQVSFELVTLDSIGFVNDLDIGKFNNDDLYDIVYSDFENDELRLLLQDGDDFNVEVISVGNGPSLIRVADLDGDGDDDFVNIADDPDVGFYQNNSVGATTMFTLSAKEAGVNISSLDLGDFNNDGLIDAAVGFISSDNLVYLENLGMHDFSIEDIDNTISFPREQVTADMNGDGFDDIVLTDFADNLLVIYYCDGNGNFTKDIIANNVNGAFGLTAGDLDGDGDMDLVVSLFNAGNIKTYINNAGNFAGSTIAFDLPKVTHLGMADFDQDGDNDLLAFRVDEAKLYIYYNDNLSFTRSLVTDIPVSSGYRLVDWDNDGKMDIICESDMFLIWIKNLGVDFDNDGFYVPEDCDDMNANINPGMTEIPYNSLDDDCDPMTLDDDLDLDGFLMAEDCDDSNSSVNPNATEVIYNGLDDDCDPMTLDDDLDLDGYDMADDCNDNNADINPGVTEIAYNGIDDDCDITTVDDDLDMDGFLVVEDCDDTNAGINPDAVDIPGNGIDEDCDGMDSVSAVDDIAGLELGCFPVPVRDVLYIDMEILTSDYTVSLYSMTGNKLIHLENVTQIDLSSYAIGTYLIRLRVLESNLLSSKKIVIAR